MTATKSRNEINAELEAILAQEAHELLMHRARRFCHAYISIKSALQAATIDHKYHLGPAMLFASNHLARGAVVALRTFKQTGWYTYTHFTGLIQVYFELNEPGMFVLLKREAQ